MEAKVREVHSGIFLVHLPLPIRPTIVNVYLIRGGDEWALIDTGVNSPDSITTFKEALATVGCAPEQVRKVISTHHHPDHYGASKAFKELTGAEVYLHREEWARTFTFAPSIRPEGALDYFIANGLPVHRWAHIPSPHDFWSSLYVTIEPDVYITDGEVIPFGKRELKVVWTSEHSPCHCVIYLPRVRVMIA